MKLTQIPYSETSYFSKIVTDYLKENENIKPFYNNFSTLENLKNQLLVQEKSKTNRKTLVKTLHLQYKNIKTTTKTKVNIELLLKENTFTITTGHQLNLFTGPLYFLYKIISTINLSEELKAKYPSYNFVPIYWMATEDHDFEEIQYFNFKNKKINWKKKSKGAVGRLSTKGLDIVFNEISELFGLGENASKLKQLFKQSYLENTSLTDATRYLTNHLFNEYGLVILDADNKNLKHEFIPFIKDELLNQTSFKEVNKTITELGKNYKIQVNPREINLFYLTDNFRERIIIENNKYKINNTKFTFTESEILEELQNHPERFSPNVIMRPLYQEVILPNLCYIGGGGELAYWLELKSYFKKVAVVFPVLLLRNSALIITEKQENKLHKLNISKKELFLQQNKLIAKKIKELSNLELDFTKQRQFLQKQFLDLEIIAKKTDASFINAVKAQEKKQLNGLKVLEKRLLKAEKRKLKNTVQRICAIQDQLFPKQNLQERYTNFSELYLEFGDDLIPFLIKNLKPLALEFSALTLIIKNLRKV
ncbi:MAG: bacillithiol biosynthesis cysteine-adding enzyme BshC [Flavobacteriaceae bacterium]|nr:bacillithiol biosynthesis cysteine-adding enzyme BshC [Flavobacteriaceae bacterium]